MAAPAACAREHQFRQVRDEEECSACGMTWIEVDGDVLCEACRRCELCVDLSRLGSGEGAAGAAGAAGAVPVPVPLARAASTPERPPSPLLPSPLLPSPSPSPSPEPEPAEPPAVQRAASEPPVARDPCTNAPLPHWEPVVEARRRSKKPSWRYEEVPSEAEAAQAALFAQARAAMARSGVQPPRATLQGAAPDGPKAPKRRGPALPRAPKQQRRTDLERALELLGLPRAVSAVDAKRRYRSLALRLHPDRNAAPNAAEAFTRMSEAFRVVIASCPPSPGGRSRSPRS